MTFPRIQAGVICSFVRPFAILIRLLQKKSLAPAAIKVYKEEHRGPFVFFGRRSVRFSQF